MRVLGVIAAAVLLACAAPAGAATTTADKQLDRALKKLVAMDGGPPGVISVIQRDGRPVVHRAGVGNLSDRTPMRSTDIMRLASASKALNAAVALALVDQGVLSLDDTIAKRLPSLPAAWGPVTLRELLQHTSGLPDFSAATAYQEGLNRDPQTPILPHQRLLDFVSTEPLDFTPGSKFAYSNTDNVVVALMAEQATGRGYDDLLSSLVYSPAGMTQTSLPDGPRLPQPYIHGYDLTEDPPEDVSTVAAMSYVWATGGISSTPDDLTSFIRADLGRKLFGQAVQDQQLQLVDGQSEPIGPGVNQAGLGIFAYSTRCGTVYGHTGNWFGYTQFAAASVDGSRSVTMSVNERLHPTLPTRTERLAFAALRRAEETAVCAAMS